LDIKRHLLDSYRRILRPLVRILLRNGVSFLEFAETVKAVYVETAARDFQVPHRRMSISRIAIMTGLTRKEASKIIFEPNKGDHEDDRGRLNRISRVLTGWSTDPTFMGPYGFPLDLPTDRNGVMEAPNFSDLVKRYSGDMPPRAMLDELLRVNAAKHLEDGSVRLLTRTYIPEALSPESIERLAMVVGNIVETLDHNVRVEREEDGRLERTVTADYGLGSIDLALFQEYLKERGAVFLEDLDSWLSSRKPMPNEKRIDLGVGLYLFIEPDTTEAPLKDMFSERELREADE
jgi:Family of unknown function (DUF6502)